MSVYRFTLPIGDWSNDGHGKCDYFTIASNKPVEEVREVHFRATKATGLSIEELEYEDSQISPEDLQTVLGLGFNDFEGEVASGEDGHMTPQAMCRLWMFLLTKTDPELTLVLEPAPAMLPFYGYDKRGRHISFVGYGLFS